MATSRDASKPDASPTPFRQRLSGERLAPLWEFFKEWFGPQPSVHAVAHLWRYADVRPLLIESAGVVSAADAERRVLVLENPGLAGERLVTDALYAGLQLIEPGETARAHRHTPAALRFIVEGTGAYTAVDGERATMRPGDFIVTPSWSWHEHANPGEGSTIWLDVLDVPLVRFLGAGFSEPRPAASEDREPAPRDAAASPAFHYPYARTRAALESLRAADDPDPHHGFRIEYLDATHGGPAIPTISTFLQLVPAGFATRSYRNTAGAVYCVAEGRGRVTIGEGDAGRTFDFDAHDLWAVPSWYPLSIEAAEDCVVFSASDRVVQEKLGLWREQREGS